MYSTDSRFGLNLVHNLCFYFNMRLRYLPLYRSLVYLRHKNTTRVPLVGIRYVRCVIDTPISYFRIPRDIVVVQGRSVDQLIDIQ